MCDQSPGPNKTHWCGTPLHQMRPYASALRNKQMRSRLPWWVSILLISNNVPEPEAKLVSSPESLHRLINR